MSPSNALKQKLVSQQEKIASSKTMLLLEQGLIKFPQK
jgi:hypothetical protein